jgi:4-hydroxy-tetrahydrodipicolinate reductase
VIRLAISGIAGRMGQALRRLIESSDDLQLTAGIDREARAGEGAARLGCLEVVVPGDAGRVLREADALVDFSAPAALRELLEADPGALAGRALVVGTTGLGEAEEALLAAVATSSPVVVAANFSVGVNLLLQLVQAAARVLTEERFDVEIVEAHHRRKVDAPSGTALALAEAAASARAAPLETVRRDGRSGQVGPRPAGEIGLHAVRGGAIVGEHRVHFIGDAERLELAHIASDRALFAEGALLAARWAAGRAPGRYRMSDVLGF